MWILSKKCLGQLYKVKKGKKKAAPADLEYELLEEIPGEKLVGLEYIPPFDYFYEVCL